MINNEARLMLSSKQLSPRLVGELTGSLSNIPSFPFHFQMFTLICHSHDEFIINVQNVRVVRQ